MDTSTQASKTTNAGGKAPRKALKPRVEGRPYKKLDGEVLMARMADIEKKLSVHDAKSVLLRDRLSLYSREKQLRDNA